MNRKYKAFTLIELLVVIAIIALLLAIIVPALKKAKMHARKLVDASNLRGLSMAVQIYLNNNNDKHCAPINGYINVYNVLSPHNVCFFYLYSRWPDMKTSCYLSGLRNANVPMIRSTNPNTSLGVEIMNSVSDSPTRTVSEATAVIAKDIEVSS